ncbi:hypothetical protein DNU06_02245 [Putridiphycobacter roseus]|uniref:Uncharacterized protein n=1 Tax=Putridiphycobacter roseus TaxID=2219161 RepID=A0A2W1N209_9FLAO|nr:T9SS type A sorting domain-containing protein [Putridiphycobacter roseus]PZE18669.1 hypothetical protein DNU06_02245 [Putridiphycobacter roseus]
MKKLFLLLILMVSFTSSIFSQNLVGVVTQVPCNNDGIYTVTATGLSLPITYTYFINGTSIVHANVNSLTDQLTNIGMDNYGYMSCQASDGSLSAWDQSGYTPSFNFYTSAISPVCPATMGTLTATQQGGSTGPFTFDWTNTQTLAVYTGNNAVVPLGEYSVVITDQTTGCVLEVSDSAANVYQISNVSATISTTDASCINGTATAVGTGGTAPYSYLWANGVTTAALSGMTQGYYPLVVTDAQGCQSNYLGAYISQNPQVSVNTSMTSATCVQSDGSVIAFGSGGVGPYSYAWGNGQNTQTASNLSGGTSQTVIVTDANGCTGQGYSYVGVNTPINVTYTATPSQCTSATGSATLTATGGTAPYTYSWNSNTAATGATLSNLDPGTYAFQVTDAVGCVRTGSVLINPISSINGSVNGSTVVCPNTTGTVSVSASGSNPPFTYLWSNGATTNVLSGVSLGGYACQITDAVGCSINKSTTLSSVSPVHIAVSTTPATCIFNTDGAVTANAYGGVAPYTYSYSGGVTTASVNNLGVGDYWVTVTDANGCSSSKHFWITNANTSSSCYCTISGNVYVDANADCVYDATEVGVENIMIHCSGIGYAFTDANGYYSFQVPSGTYTISEQVNAYYPLAACQSNTNSVSVTAATGCNTVVNIANDMNIIHDLKIVTVNANIPPIPGNNYQQKVIVKNQGTVTESGVQMGYEQDAQVSFLNSTSLNFVQLNNIAAPYAYSIQSGFPSLSPNASNVMLLNYSAPTNIPLGTVLNFYDTVANVAPIDVNWLLDYTPWNNVNTYQPVVIGSYDPNYKEVSPRGQGVEGFVSMDTKEFDYTIHFQNEGTYFAQNISVTDQLDADLDWTTLKPGYSDYAYTTTVSETGLVTFFFENINLPWKSTYGDALSSGLISYSIQPIAGSPLGTEFTNTADIFFDYNAPITTNTTLNTFMKVTSIDAVSQTIENEITIDLYPVPAKDLITIRVNNVSQNSTATLSIVNLMGSVVMTEKISLNEGATILNQNVSNLAAGTYLARMQFEDGSAMLKKIVLF